MGKKLNKKLQHIITCYTFLESLNILLEFDVYLKLLEQIVFEKFNFKIIILEKKYFFVF